MSGSVAGAEMMTFWAPASRCLAASARLVKKPVDSMTTSTPRSLHGKLAGSRSARTFSGLPSTMIASSATSMVPGYGPRIEANFRSWPRVLGSVRSLTATHSMSVSLACAARKMFRPMRPKPLIPTRTGIGVESFLRGADLRSHLTLSVIVASVPARDDLDPKAVGVPQIGRVIALSVLRARPRRAVVGAAGPQPRGVGGGDPHATGGLHGDVAVAGRRLPAALHDPEPRLVAAVGDRRRRLVHAADPQARE